MLKNISYCFTLPSRSLLRDCSPIDPIEQSIGKVEKLMVSRAGFCAHSVPVWVSVSPSVQFLVVAQVASQSATGQGLGARKKWKESSNSLTEASSTFRRWEFLIKSLPVSPHNVHHTLRVVWWDSSCYLYKPANDKEMFMGHSAIGNGTLGRAKSWSKKLENFVKALAINWFCINEELLPRVLRRALTYALEWRLFQ